MNILSTTPNVGQVTRYFSTFLSEINVKTKNKEIKARRPLLILKTNLNILTT